jgi:O-acetyl-ADP-ribose deacetylase (regulator of RNase III)
MSHYWTNSSVLDFAGQRDPVKAIEEAAQQAVFDAVENGWKGPPFDPFELARIRDIEVIPRNELREARTVSIGQGRLAIEYNPTRPSHRIRFSIAHEIAHTLFADVANQPRYRHNPAEGPPDGWQLEMLCNVAAAELLMPTEMLTELQDRPHQIEDLLAMRATFGVSVEVLLRRATKLATYPLAMFAAARSDPEALDSDFRIDYTVPSLAWQLPIESGTKLAANSVLADCTAVGYTAKRSEDWSDHLQDVSVQAVGTPPYPGQRLPRVLGWVQPRGVRRVSKREVIEVHGDATKPRGSEKAAMIVHLVNDRTPNWGGKFAGALLDRYPASQEDFQQWFAEDKARLKLGGLRVARIANGLSIATVVAQRGYGPSTKPRIRYGALREALESVATVAKSEGLSVHMPRIGAGQAGGRWPVVREIIDEALTRRGIPVTVYVPPDEPIAEGPEPYTALRLDL